MDVARLTLFSMAVSVALPALAQANDVYVGVRGGFISPLASMHELDRDTFELTFEPFLFGGVYIGSSLGSGFRGELSLDAMRFDVVSGNEGAGNIDPITGATDAVTLTASLWRDLPQIGAVMPYVGLGAGLAWTSPGFVLNNANNAAPPANLEGFGGSDISAVGLVGAGVRVDLGQRLALDVGYRLMSVINARSEEYRIGAPTESIQFGIGHYTSHLFSAGLNYQFGEEGPAQPSSLHGPLYVGGYLGAAWTPDTHVAYDHGELGPATFDGPTGNFGFVAGTNIASRVRGELEVGFIRSEPDRLFDRTAQGSPTFPTRGSFDQTFVFTNLWQDFGNGPLTPYAGGGLGLAFVDYEINDYPADAGGPSSYESSSTVFAGQVGLGVRFAKSPNLTFDLGYRFRGALGTVLTDGQNARVPLGNARATLYSHAVQAGVTYAFDTPGDVDRPMGTENHAYLSLAMGTGHAVSEVLTETSHPIHNRPPASVSIAYGQHVTDYLRAEVELSATHIGADETRNDDVDDPLVPVDGDTTQIAILTNYWADFDLGFAQPYVGGGVGMALVDTDYAFDDVTISGNWSPTLALQAGGGFRAPLTDNLLVDIGYRYRATIDAFADGLQGSTNRDAASITHESHIVQAALVLELGAH